MSIDEKFKHLKLWLDIWIDLKATGQFKGTRHYDLPTFDYYLDNLGNNSYDLNNRPYKTVPNQLNNNSIINYRKQDITDFYTYFKYNYWMGLPFNIKEYICIDNKEIELNKLKSKL